MSFLAPNIGAPPPPPPPPPNPPILAGTALSGNQAQTAAAAAAGGGFDATIANAGGAQGASAPATAKKALLGGTA
jgi:hypothetical protein